MEPPPDRFRMESTDAAAWLQAVGRTGGRLGRRNTSQLAIRVTYGNARASQFRRAASGRWRQTLPWRRQRLLPPTGDAAANDRICAVGFASGPGYVDLRKVLHLD